MDLITANTYYNNIIHIDPKQERSSTLTISLSYTGGKLFIMYNEVTANLAGSVSHAIALGKPQLLWLQAALQAMQYNMMLLWLVTL